ncbi:hypothetical protein [uncultured Parabacteroides sp.]|uniref:hypothetical protein n=1 Tax=uncultured Parabacteroides sp. TaxID=512312 RepID=UPI0025E002D8|nr:hypothetical protein [uncultured Parabacteroides sp.]
MKKYQIITAIVFASSCCFTGNAQTYDHFDLSSFITPDIVRNELDFTLNSSGKISDQKGSKTDYSSLNGDFQTTFNRLKNTRPYWGVQRGQLSINGKYSNSKQTENKENQYDASFSYSSTNRFYKSDNRFFDITGNIREEIIGSKVHEPYSKNKTNYFYGYVSPGVGKGRIESVTDARQAVYILNNLSKRGILKRQLSNEEILELSKLISVVKNKRFFDARLRMIDEITAVDSFFVTNQLLNTSGAPYFTTLYDYWMYGDRFQRSAGLVFRGGLLGGYTHDRTDYKNKEYDDSYYKTSTPFAGAKVTMEYERPVNLYWQQSAYINLRGQYEWVSYNTAHSDGSKHNNYVTDLSASYSWGYYPTSRTNINFGIKEYLSWVGTKNREGDSELTKDLDSNTLATFQTYYYFSPQLRLSAQVEGGLKYYNMKYKNEYRDNYNQLGWTGSFQLTLTYSLF